MVETTDEVIDEVISRIKGRIGWLEWVADKELTSDEKKSLESLAKQVEETINPILERLDL